MLDIGWGLIYNILVTMDKMTFMRLWDLYHGILTPTQQEITDLYFNYDLTLSEIAERKGVSRQGVSECLAKCKNQLKEYEGKLGLEKMLTEGDLYASFMRTDASRWADAFLQLHPEYAADINELQQILNKDYAQEIDSAIKNKK